MRMRVDAEKFREAIEERFGIQLRCWDVDGDGVFLGIIYDGCNDAIPGSVVNQPVWRTMRTVD